MNSSILFTTLLYSRQLLKKKIRFKLFPCLVSALTRLQYSFPTTWQPPWLLSSLRLKSYSCFYYMIIIKLTSMLYTLFSFLSSESIIFFHIQVIRNNHYTNLKFDLSNSFQYFPISYWRKKRTNLNCRLKMLKSRTFCFSVYIFFVT